MICQSFFGLRSQWVSCLCLAAAVVGLTGSAGGQAGSVQPIPFASTVAGIAAGSGNTACTTGIANQGGQTIGDGCLPTQATLVSLYDASVDTAGNLYIPENGTNTDIRVVYNGGTALTAVLIGANTGIAGFTTPKAGYIYTVAGGRSAALTSHSGVYYCGNVTGGQIALNSIGDGCPAAESYLKPRGIFIDANGNIFSTSNGGGAFLRVIYAGGAQVANLIATETPGTVPQVGYIYTIAGGTATGYAGDGGLAKGAEFVQIRYVVGDSNGNLFVSDGNTPSGTGASTIVAAGNNVRRIDGVTGIITTFAGQHNCTYVSTTGCPFGSSGDGGPATSALFNSPYVIFVDRSNNLYIADYTNAKLRVVYQGGTIPGIANPVIGNVYTYAGGGTLTANGTPANQLSFVQVAVAGIDPANNIYVEDTGNHVLWKFNAATAIGNVIAGDGLSPAPTAGAFCSGSSGPTSTDNYGDGCPALQASISDIGQVNFDQAGNFYVAESGNLIVRRMSFNTQFPATADASSATQPLAFESLAAPTLTGPTYALQGATTAEFASSGTTTCSLSGTFTAGTVCVYYVTFKPAHPGLREGSLQFGTVGGTALTEYLSGDGVGSDIAIDAGTQSTLGTGLTPSGVGTDLLGNVYLADSASNSVFKGSATGTTLTKLIPGLNNPAQVAVDGQGNVYVADSGNNRVLQTNNTGATLLALGTGLLKPQGVTVDGAGNIFVSDTGNNRVLQLFASGGQNILPITGLSAPTVLALYSTGDLFILDSGNSRIVEYGPAGQSVVVIDSGVKPAGIAVDSAGNLYVNDANNLRTLVYPAGGAPSEIVLTGLKAPVALVADPDANLFVADTQLTGALELRRSVGNVVFPLTNVGQTTSGSFTVNNVGNSGLTFPSAPLTTVTGSTLFTVAPASSNGCATGTTYMPGASCNFTASFSPAATGKSSASVNFNTNAADNASTSAVLNGSGLLLTTTTTTLSVTSPSGSVFFGQTVILTAALQPSTTTSTPTGTFTFTVDGKTQPTQSIGNGMVALTLTNLSATPHTVSVTYSGDGTYASSAATSSFTVNQATTATAFTVVPTTINGALNLVFTATVTSPYATGEAGTVGFYAGSVLIGNASINAAGVATFNTTALAFASNNLTAVYSGNTNFAGSTSSVIAESGDFAVAVPGTTLSISAGGVANTNFTIASLYNGAGTVTPTCTNLPANTVCRFLPLTVPLAATPQQVSLQLYTNVPSTIALDRKSERGQTIAWACGLPLSLSLIWLRRRSARKLLAGAIAAVGCMAVLGLLGGCGGSTSTTTPVTAAGSYAISIVFTGSAGLTTTHTIPISLTVVQDSGAF